MTPVTSRSLTGGIALVAILGACSGPSDCTQVEVPAIVGTVRDRANNGVVTDGAVGQIRSGSFHASFAPYEMDAQAKPLTLAAYAPNGTYSAAISRSGYDGWDSVVTVASDLACQSDRTQNITARLDPL